MGSGVTPPLSPPETVEQSKVPKLQCSSVRTELYWFISSLELLNGLTFEQIALVSDVRSQLNTGVLQEAVCRIRKYGQAARPISTGKLQPLLVFHIRPINLLV